MRLTKFEIKVLRYIKKNPNKSNAIQLRNKYRKGNIDHCIEKLLSNKYIESNCAPYLGDKTIVLPSPEEEYFSVTDEGIVEVESHQWLNKQLFILQIVLPIVISVISTLITIFLTFWLSPSL